MGIKGIDMDIDLTNTSVEVTKHMLPDPRRVAKIEVKLNMPSALQLDEKDKTILERVGNNCPVTKSLHPDMQVEIQYNW